MRGVGAGAGAAKKRKVGALSELPRSRPRGERQARVMHTGVGGDIPMDYNWYMPKAFLPTSWTAGGGGAQLVEQDDAAPSPPSHCHRWVPSLRVSQMPSAGAGAAQPRCGTSALPGRNSGRPPRCPQNERRRSHRSQPCHDFPPRDRSLKPSRSGVEVCRRFPLLGTSSARHAQSARCYPPRQGKTRSTRLVP